VTGETVSVGLDSPSMVRAAIGVGLLWDSPLGPLRFDLAYPLTKYCATGTDGSSQICDRTQVFRFSGGTRF
jgi:outer membrane protein insertion porin family